MPRRGNRGKLASNRNCKTWYKSEQGGTASVQRFLRPWRQRRIWLWQISDNTTVKVWTRNFQRLLPSLSACNTSYLLTFCDPFRVPASGGLSTKERWTQWRVQQRLTTTKGPEASLLEGKAERDGTVQPRWEGLGQIPTIHTGVWRQGVRQTEPDSFQWWPVPREKVTGTDWNMGGSIWTYGREFAVITLGDL